MPAILRRVLLFMGALCIASSIFNPVFLKGDSVLHFSIFLSTTAISVLAIVVVIIGRRSFLSSYPASEVNWAFTPFFLSALISLVVLAAVLYVKLGNA